MSIRLEHVCYQHKDMKGTEQYTLKDINLSIEDGEYIGIIGHTGSGKSTFLQLLNGLESPTTGNIYYNGINIQDKGFDRVGLRTKVGLVFQYPEYQLFESSVIKDIKFGPKNLGLEPLEVDLRSYQAFRDVGLHEKYLDASPFQLSGGQKRRVAIAGILAMQPEVLILDEPTAGLDPVGRKEILSLIDRLHKEKHCTVIVVSHSMEDMANHVERLVVLYDGQIRLDGSPKEVFQEETVLEKYGLSVPSVNRIAKRLEKDGYRLDTSVITVEEAKEAILDCYGSRHM